MQCPKRAPDPLLAAMIKQYGFVPVSPPQADLPLGSVVAFDGSTFRGRSVLARLLVEAPALPVAKETMMRHLLDDFSDHVDIDAGLGLVGDFLGAAGSDETSAKLGAAARAARARSLRLSVTNGIIRALDPLVLEDAIKSIAVLRENPFIRGQLKIYVVHRTWHAEKVKISFYDKDSQAVSLDASALQGLKGNAKVKVASSGNDKLSFDCGTEPVCFALDAVRLICRDDRFVLDLRERPSGVARGSFADDAPAHFSVAGEEWGPSAFLEVGGME
jgi:hypothetical protein